MKDIRDVITHAKFGDDRLRGSGVVAGQISAFPIDFAGRPYNTLTLPCERVITSYVDVGSVIKNRGYRKQHLKCYFVPILIRRLAQPLTRSLSLTLRCNRQ